MLEQIKKDIQNGERVIYKIGAEWCPPCKTQQKIIDQILTENEHFKNRIISVDLDQHPEIVEYFEIKSVPTTIYVGNGNYKISATLQSKEDLTDWLI